uniref:Uncharacterized protein n=1 Tax=Tanacetum cinerariifolium TaxID=118510 RepID=A0A699HN01_TANCI|nr:hypothetical protein [Tanacetum cinerariifolium]
MIEEIYQNAEIALDDETQGRRNDDEMFLINDLAREEVVVDTTTSKLEEQIIEDVSTVEPVTTADEVVTTNVKDSDAPTTDQAMSTTIPTTVTIVTTTVPTPRTKGIIFHEQKQSQIPTVSSLKDKGKAKMIEPEVPIKKKDQMRIDEECARRLEAMMDADRLLAERLQAREREELSEVQKARLEIRKVNDFIAMDSETQESSTKRIAKHLESDISKKQKVDENVKPVIDDNEEIKKCMEIVLDDGDEHFNKEDLEVLWAIVKDKFNKDKPMDEMDNLLFRTLKTMFEHHVEDNIWQYQQGLAKLVLLKDYKCLKSSTVKWIKMCKEIKIRWDQQVMIEEIDQNVEIALDDETQGKINDDEMFGVDDLTGEEVVVDTVIGCGIRVRDECYNSSCCYNSYNCCPNSKSQRYFFHEQKQSQIPIKKKDQMRIDEEYARRLEAKEQDATRLSRAQQDEKANNSLDNKQAMMDADRLLAVRLQTREREEFSKVQKARLLVELIVKRKKHFAALRAQEKRNKPHTKTQIKSQMSTYLKHMGGYKQSHLKQKSFDEIKKVYDREIRKQKVDENVKLVIDDFQELKKCMEIVPDDGDEVLIETTPLSSRSPTIIDYKIYKEGKKTYFKIIRADGNSQAYQTFEKMFKNFNKEDLEVL